ncbi:hypothetical protein QT231_05200 [Halomonas sp. SpR1]|uniref:hypothetical protein n=1 Tax=Halomonas sp. SpR1 TaxID=3050462 RepID=UPI0027E41833|nr:hypothetical protein [Halomonas sp. SpR1]MDQ7732083.1 hypothetical protein [Halomonas sp. SpR1]
MNTIELNLSFKEKRNYLNGADFYFAIEKTINIIDKGWLKKLTFKNFAYNKCIINFEKPDINKKIVAIGIWQSPNETSYKIWVTETSLAVLDRISFKEEEIIKNSETTQNRIRLNKKNKYSTIENIVSLTKELNYQISPKIAGKWVFGQIDLLKKLPSNYKEITIIHTGGRNSSFSRNQIIIEDLTYGEIRFIVGKP